MNILVTAGPTKEFLDPVRFLSNSSSGRMGVFLAEEAHRRDHDVELVLGPSGIEPNPSLRVMEVTSAQDMHEALEARFEWCDLLIMTAAVSDVRPASRNPDKIKKDEGLDQFEIEFTPDILEQLGRRKEDRTLIGFAVESTDLEANGRRKLKEKNLDLIVLNRPEAMGAAENRVHLIRENEPMESWPRMNKRTLAGKLVDRFLELS